MRWMHGRAAQSMESLERELKPVCPGAAASLGPCSSERHSLRPCITLVVLVASPARDQAPGRVKAQESVCGSRKALLGGVSVNKHRTEPQHVGDLSNQMGMHRALM